MSEIMTGTTSVLYEPRYEVLAVAAHAVLNPTGCVLREISDMGVERATAVAAHLREMQWIPQMLLCSNSKRTKQTVEAMGRVRNTSS